MPGSLDGLLTNRPFLVVDSWPVMEWLKKREPATSRFRSLIENARAGNIILLLSSINLGEIYYNCWNEWDEVRAEEVLADFDDLPVDIIHPTRADTITAARIKARYKGSYADAFTTALALDYHAAVVTGDKDFLKFRHSGLIDVEWWGT